MGSARIVKHHLPARRHAGTRSGSRIYHTSSFLGIHVMNRPVTSQYPVERRLLASGLLAVYWRSAACSPRTAAI